MLKNFYTHLINYEEVYIELDKLDLSEKERHHLAELIDANLHNSIIEAVLSELSDKDKHVFLKHLSEQNHDKIWELLNTKADNIEDKIRLAAEDLKKEIHKDIKEAKNK